MSLDFYSLSDKKNVLFSLNDKEFNLLQEEFKLFYEKTAIEIDQYGTTRLSVEHIRLLLRLIEVQSGDNINFKQKIIDFLKIAYDNNNCLVIEGN